MRYRSRPYRSDTAPRVITAKFAGVCHCCGGAIAAGEMVDYYPAKRAIAHYKALEGNSPKCTVEIRRKHHPEYAAEIERRNHVRDPGEDAADRWNETHGDRW